MRRRDFMMAGALLLASCAAPNATRTPPFHSDRISVTASGSGPDVVLIAGAVSRASEVWAGTMQAVPGYRYHVVQVAGFGGYPVAGNVAPGPLVEPIGEEIARYIRGLNRPALIGLSMGGTLGMMIAARHPQTLSKLMVVDMVPFMGTFFGPPGAVTPQRAVPIAEAVRSRILAMDDDARRRDLSESIDKMIRTESVKPGVLQAAEASDPAVYAQAMHDLITLDLRSEMANVKVPVTVLYVHAPLIPISAEQTDEVYRSAFKDAPRAKLKRIPNAYHFIMLDQPTRFAAEVREFLR